MPSPSASASASPGPSPIPVLFDTVAVYLAFSQAGLKIERLSIGVTDRGMTVIDPRGKSPLLDVATEWRDLESFDRLLVGRLAHRAAPLSR